MHSAIANTVRELQYNLALSYMDDSRHGAASEILEDLYQQWPNEHRFGVRLAHTYLALDRMAELRSVVEDLATRRKEDAEAARKELLEYRKQIQERLDAEETDTEETDAEKPGQKLTEQEKQTMRTLRGHARYNPHWVEFMWGNVHLAEGSYDQALTCFQNAEQADPSRPRLHLQLGETYLRMRKAQHAEPCYEKALEIDPNHARAWLGLARCSLRRRKAGRAEELARKSLGLLYSDAYAHFILGVALHRLKKTEEAVDALETALSLNPNFPQAHRRLAMIYRTFFQDNDQAGYHFRLAVQMRGDLKKRRAETSKRPYASDLVRESLIPERPAERSAPEATEVGGVVTVVTGLPRSGTSMIMQMLQAGGMDVVTDGVREADEDNPRGYLEFEGAKRLQTDRAWVGQAVGHCVKIVAQLLPCLPNNFQYRIVMIHRNLDEVLRSQATMLERQETEGAQLSDATRP